MRTREGGCPQPPRPALLRRAFTLVELLVIIAIIAVMTTASVLSIRAGQGAARIRGASRDIFATIRQARSVALVTQQPAIITYSEESLEGETSAKIVITSAKLMSGEGVKNAVTLSGEPVSLGDTAEPDAAAEDGRSPKAGTEESSSTGETVEEILFAPMSEETVKGVRIKVTKGDEELDVAADANDKRRASKISVFSNVDFLLGRYEEAQKKKAEPDDDETEGETLSLPAATAAATDLQEATSFVWEVNGRCEPHKVWVYAAGETPDKGLCISVDRFGAAKILSEDER